MAPQTDSSLAAGRSATPVRYCHHCGAPIRTGDWYPVVARTDDTGAVDLLAFCDEQCRHDWRH